MGVECYSFSGKAQDQFRRRKIINAQMRDRDAVANVTETLLVTLDCLVTQLSGQIGYRGLFTESLDNLREFAFEAENDFGGLKQLGDHGGPLEEGSGAPSDPSTRASAMAGGRSLGVSSGS